MMNLNSIDQALYEKTLTFIEDKMPICYQQEPFEIRTVNDEIQDSDDQLCESKMKRQRLQ